MAPLFHVKHVWTWAKHVLVSVAVCPEEDAPISVFSLQQFEYEAPSQEEVNRERALCLCVFKCALYYKCCWLSAVIRVYCTAPSSSCHPARSPELCWVLLSHCWLITANSKWWHSITVNHSHSVTVSGACWKLFRWVWPRLYEPVVELGHSQSACVE